MGQIVFLDFFFQRKDILKVEVVYFFLYLHFLLLWLLFLGGTVRIYGENDKLEPIASVFDPLVLPVNYVSFCAYDNLVRFYYDCSGQH